MDDFEGAMEASRMANMLQHVPLAMSLCRVDYANHLKMQSSLSNHMYAPNAFEGILELRKEKSRDAARSRRGKENYEFYELAKLLPLPAAITSQLDKASIIRLTISYLKLRDFSSHGDPPWQRDGPTSSVSKAAAKGSPSQRHSSMAMAQDIFETHQGTHILQSVDGFAFALSNDGRFLYISETVSIYLGLSQVEMAGSSIFEYIHSHDHKELAEQLGLNQPKGSYYTSLGSDSSDEGSSTPNPPRSSTPSISERVSVMSPNPSKGYDRCFCIRMKSTLTKRGVHFKSSGYRVVQIVAHLRPQMSFPTSPRKQLPPLLGLVGVAIALPPPTITELIIDNDMFVTRLSPQLKVTYCEPRIADVMDITSEDLVNKNLYDFCHAEDLQKLHKAHVDLLNKGQVLTDYYRLMNRHGGYVWLQTCATIICNAKNVDEQNIIAINYVLSGIEYAGCVMNLDQYRAVSKTELDITDRSDTDNIMDPDLSASQSRAHLSVINPVVAAAADVHCAGGGAVRLLGGSKSPRQSVTTCRQPIGGQSDGQDLDGLMSGADNGGSELLSTSGHEDSARYGRRRGTTTPVGGGGGGSEGCGRDGTKAGGMLANSRRKTDKPRKRKRAGCDNPTTAPPCTDPKSAKTTDQLQMVTDLLVGTSASEMDGVESGRLGRGGSLDNGGGIGSRSAASAIADSSTGPLAAVSSTAVTPPLPEDLSTVRAEDDGDCTGSPTHLSCSSPCPRDGVDQLHHQSWLLGGGVSAPDSPTLCAGATSIYSGSGLAVAVSGGTASSVHELEAAMNKHLPVATDLQTDMYCSSAGQHRSAIQWIGGTAVGTEQDPTSTLLRSLYSGQRESVIRTNVYSNNNNSSQRHYYSNSAPVDAQSILLTPPGPGDVYRTDSAFMSAASLTHSSKTSPNGGGSSAAAAAAAVAAMGHAASGGVGYGLMGYGSTGIDAYAMTPPSSVSPQDAYTAAVSQYSLEHPTDAGLYHHAAAAHHLHHQHHNAMKSLHYGGTGTGSGSTSAAVAYDQSAAMSYHQAAAAAAMAAGYYSSNGGLAAYGVHYRDAMKHANATW
jgi:neuronal PAS domain-containing protein 1/3